MTSQAPLLEVAPLVALLVALGVFLVARPGWVQNWVIRQSRRGWYFRVTGRLPCQVLVQSDLYPTFIRLFGVVVLVFAAAVLTLAAVAQWTPSAIGRG
jgi:hypothetical protein